MSDDPLARPVYIRGPQLRKRWGGMSNSSFYDRLARGQIPPPCFPFGPNTPHWLIADIEAHERKAQESQTIAAAPPPEPTVKRGPGRPRKTLPSAARAR